MRETRTSGSAGALGEQSPGATQKEKVDLPHGVREGRACRRSLTLGHAAAAGRMTNHQRGIGRERRCRYENFNAGRSWLRRAARWPCRTKPTDRVARLRK